MNYCPVANVSSNILISAGVSTFGAIRRFALWRTSRMGFESNSSYRTAWLKSIDMTFRSLAQVLLARGKLRSQDSTSIVRTSPSSHV